MKPIIWVPCNLSNIDLTDRMRIYSSLLITDNGEAITRDENWIHYENVKKQKKKFNANLEHIRHNNRKPKSLSAEEKVRRRDPVCLRATYKCEHKY